MYRDKHQVIKIINYKLSIINYQLCELTELIVPFLAEAADEGLA